MHDRPLPSSTQASLRNQPTRVQRFGLLAGVCLVALAVGSLAMVFVTSRQPPPSPAPVGTSHPSATAARPTLVAYHPGKSLGTIVYSTTISETVGPNGLYALAWSPDSTRLGVATLVSAQSWVATTGKGVVTYVRAQGVVFSWSPDGQYVAVSQYSQGVQIYDARTGVLVKTYPNPAQEPVVGATAWSPDGHLMATFFEGSFNHTTMQLWNTSTGKLVHTYPGNVGSVWSLSWSADGTSLASSNGVSVQVWNALTGQRIYDFEQNTNCFGKTAVAWSPVGQTLAYLSCDQVRVVNPFTGQLLTTHTGPHDSSGLSALAWSPDGKYIASAGDHVEVWNVATGRTFYTFTKNASPIERLAWSPDGKYIASANASPPPPFTVPVTIQVWSAE